MACYVDKLRNWGWKHGASCHLIADTNEELHAMAIAIGLKREWFQKSTSCPHYDLTASRRKLAVARGAIELEDRPFHAIITAWRVAAKAAILAAAEGEERDRVREHLYR